MELILHKLVATVLLRPYVFIFLLVYLAGCSTHLGIKRALLFLPVGYLITWLSEYLSINTGIPYGLYYYIEHTKEYELWVLGVPFMDSLSYVFLSYASYAFALLVLSPVVRTGRAVYVLETRSIRNSLHATLLGTLFFVYLDIIIDPVALQGEQWFLGELYGYTEEGAYFGVPITNFIGWSLVGFILISALQAIDHRLAMKDIRDTTMFNHPVRFFIGPLLYLGVGAFIISVAFSIHEYTIGWVGVFLIGLPLSLSGTILKVKLSHAQGREEAIAAHIRDFPHSILGLSKNPVHE